MLKQNLNNRDLRMASPQVKWPSRPGRRHLACPVALMPCPAPSNSQVENRQWTPIDANQKQDLSSRAYYPTAAFVHWRPFAVDQNSYGADGSLKTPIASSDFF